MVSLIDIVPQTRTVRIADGELVLRGLGLRQIAGLLLRFPELRKYLVAEGAPAVDPDALLSQMPGCVGAIIAEAAGQPEAEEAIEDKMRLEDIMECLTTIHILTIPDSSGPLFLYLLRALGGVPASESPGEVLDMNMPRRQSA
jgi:hypothetical protein